MKFLVSDEYKNASGIYIIRCAFDKRTYIGSTINFRTRYNMHKKHMRNEKHHSWKINQLIRNYGIDCFTFEVLELIDQSSIREAEQLRINEAILAGRELLNISLDVDANASAPIATVNMLCAGCGQEFAVKPYRLAAGERRGHPKRFCSRGCANRGRKRITKKIRTCLGCGTLMDLENKDAKRLYCNSKCWPRRKAEKAPKKKYLANRPPRKTQEELAIIRREASIKAAQTRAKQREGKPPIKLSEETRRKMSDAAKRRPKEFYNNFLAAGAKMAKERPLEFYHKLAATRKPAVLTPEGRQRLSEAGKRAGAATAAMKYDKSHLHTPEVIAKRVASRKAGAGYSPSTETRRKLSESLTGRKIPPEQIAKRSAAFRANNSVKKAAQSSPSE